MHYSKNANMNCNLKKQQILLRMTQQFSQKAGRLLDRINSISYRDRKQKINETTLSSLNLNKSELGKTMGNRNFNILPTSPQTQTLLELGKIQQDISQNEEDNIRKIRNINDQVRKIELFIKEQSETRLKIHETFINSIVKAEKNMQTTLAGVRKLYSERQKRLQSKISQVLNQQKKQILQQMQLNNNLQQNLTRIKSTILSTKQEIIQMRRTRIQLQDKISRQFNDQISDLKTIFSNSIRVRQEKQLKILDMLKNVYKKHMDTIKKEEVERQSNQKMFLTVIEQLIDRITQA